MSLQLRLSLSRALGYLGVWNHLERSVFKEPRSSCVAKIKVVFLVLFLLGFLLHTLDLSYESKWAKERDESKG